MAFDRFLIGYNDNNSGFQSNLKPWLITDNAFEQLNNMYVLRGRLKKRFGTILMGGDQTSSRLRLDTSASYSDGIYSGTVPGSIFAVGQMFSVGEDIYTVYQLGTPAAMLSNNPLTSGTYDTSIGAFTITGESAAITVYFYPSTPVMGLTQYYVESTNSYNTLAFDTQFSYQFDPIGLGWFRNSTGVSVWTGLDFQLFWMTDYQGAVSSSDALWVSNFNANDGIRYWDNTTWNKPILNWTIGTQINTTGTGTFTGTVPGSSGFIGQIFTIGTTQFLVVVANGALTPISYSTALPLGNGTFNTSTGAYTFTGTLANASLFFTGNNYIQTAQIIIQFQNRLLLLNTVELVNGVSTNFPNRVRYSAEGSALSASSWMQDIPGNGSAIDASSQEAIITAQFVKNRLIVYFSSSTYELVYNSNQALPFVWQKINNELGAISTFSEIPFDKVTLGIDDTGIHACNGANVERIDNKIPQYPFSISNDEHGQDRVSGIRDYYNEMAYWTIPTTNRSNSFYFPNQILVYNYVNDSWATIDDSFTTFGYFFLPAASDGLTWGQTTTQWGRNVRLWNSNTSTTNTSTTKAVIAGNQQGFVAVVQSDIVGNAQSLQITNFIINSDLTITISCINHNLSFASFVLLTGMNGLIFTDSLGNIMDSLMGRVSVDPVSADTPNSFIITALDNASQLIVITGTYLGGGNATLVSNLNVLTKQYNFYTEHDRNMYLSKVDFLVDSTQNGAVTADYLVSSTTISLVSEGLGTLASPGPLPGDGTLETSPYSLSNFEQFQTRLWHPVYMYAEGECVQLQLYMSPNQMYSYIVNCDGTTSYVALNDFQMHAMVFYVTATTSRMQ